MKRPRDVPSMRCLLVSCVICSLQVNNIGMDTIFQILHQFRLILTSGLNSLSRRYFERRRATKGIPIVGTNGVGTILRFSIYTNSQKISGFLAGWLMQWLVIRRWGSTVYSKCGRRSSKKFVMKLLPIQYWSESKRFDPRATLK